MASAPPSAEVGGDAAGHDAVPHQPVAEGGVGGAQHALAQHAAMGVHQREGGIVADRADVAEMVGEPLEFGHQRAQPDGARRHVDVRAPLRRRARKRESIGDGAVARGAAGECAPRVEVGAGHQPLDALVHVAEPLFEPDHGLAVGGEAEMPGLDDAGMHRADRDLVQAFAFGRRGNA